MSLVLLFSSLFHLINNLRNQVSIPWERSITIVSLVVMNSLYFVLDNTNVLQLP
jgi:hypothetical protein